MTQSSVRNVILHAPPQLHAAKQRHEAAETRATEATADAARHLRSLEEASGSKSTASSAEAERALQEARAEAAQHREEAAEHRESGAAAQERHAAEAAALQGSQRELEAALAAAKLAHEEALAAEQARAREQQTARETEAERALQEARAEAAASHALQLKAAIANLCSERDGAAAASAIVSLQDSAQKQARPAVLGSWDTFQGPSQNRMTYATC